MIYLLEFLILLLIFGILDYFTCHSKRIFISTVIRIIVSLVFSNLLYYLIMHTLTINTYNQVYISTSILFIIHTVLSYKRAKKIPFINFIIKAISVILILELTIFNYKHYLTLNLPSNSVTNIELINLEKNNGKYKVTDKNFAGIKITLKNKNINSMYFPIKNTRSDLVNYTIKVYLPDNDGYVTYNKTNSYNGITKSYYKEIHHTIDSKTLFIQFNDYKGNFSFSNILVNTNIPIFFSTTRVITLIVIALAMYTFRTSSIIYKMSFTSKSGRLIVALFICGMMLLSYFIVNLNPVFHENNSYKYLYHLVSVNEYQKLTESLIDGKLYLDIKPSKTLQNMNNPYDPYARSKLFKNNSDKYLWDVAYYNNNYYVYFGIVPVVTTYLPYYLITGHHIDNNLVNFIGVVGIIISFVYLIKIIMKKYFNNDNLGILLLISIFSLLANHFLILYVIRRPDFYNIPIVYGIMFSLIGLNLWLRSIKSDNKLNKIYLFLGSLSMALVSGCRPQLLLVSASSIFIFKDYLRKDKLFSRKHIIDFIIFIIPYVIIGSLIATYNYLRFSSIIDFGANYNLTTNDMTARGFIFERVFSTIYYYLLAIPKINNVFPFIELLPLRTSYIGYTCYENTFGGMFMLCPLLIISLFSKYFKKYSKSLYNLTVLLPICGIIIMLMDGQMAGILPRYFLDFSWLFILSTDIILISILSNKKVFKTIISYLSKLVILIIVFNFFLSFIDVSFDYKTILPSMFYHFYYFIQFWL